MSDKFIEPGTNVWRLLASYVGQETVQSYISAEVTSGATSLYEEGIKYVQQCLL